MARLAHRSTIDSTADQEGAPSADRRLHSGLHHAGGSESTGSHGARNGQTRLPAGREDQDNWFEPYLGNVDHKNRERYEKMAKNLKRGLVYGNPHSVIGLVCSCLDFALNDSAKIEGVFKATHDAFRFTGARNLLARMTSANEFRNTYVAHHQKDLTDKNMAGQNLKQWVETIVLLKG